MQTGIYRHYKGGYYQVLGVAEHTETNERMVVYVSLAGIHMPGPRLRVRPLEGPEGWNTRVVYAKGVSTVNAPRFVYVGYELPVGELPK